jgi:hypothetical protein
VITPFSSRQLAILALLAATVASPAAAADNTFDHHFTDQTLRFDYYHSGTSGNSPQEHISADRLRREGPWPGSRTRLLDDTDLGKYRFLVIDPATGTLLYSRGFASIYGEWETTGEAQAGLWRTFHESQRFPEPRTPVRLALEKRSPAGDWHEIYSAVFDPAATTVDRSPVLASGTVTVLFEHGPPAAKVDLLLVGDGYTRSDAEEFVADADRLTAALFATEPFGRRRGDFNARALFVASPESGITDSTTGVWRNTPLGLAYGAFGSERYVLTEANRELREIAAQAPYDALILLANSRKYGGGGIHGLWTTAAAGSGQAAYLVVHEFGHSFAGLADEYYTSPVSYEEFTPPGTEPWEPNVTALGDPERLKWRDLVSDGTPLPTAWRQERFDEASRAYQKRREALRAAGAPEEEMEALFAEIEAVTEPMLHSEEHWGEVGAFEGAAYQARGLYRPYLDCIMFTRNPEWFCPVCARAIERVIDLYAE